jgi:hypothetical protein
MNAVRLVFKAMFGVLLVLNLIVVFRAIAAENWWDVFECGSGAVACVVMLLIPEPPRYP